MYFFRKFEKMMAILEYNFCLKQGKTMKTMNNNELIVNGETYLKQNAESEYKIVRTHSAGVFFGVIESRTGQEVVLLNARRIWYWSGAASLSQFAMEGTKTPQECKFPCAVDRVTLLQVIEILDVTKQAKKSIDGVPVWKG